MDFEETVVTSKPFTSKAPLMLMRLRPVFVSNTALDPYFTPSIEYL
jgi:hypothetical protein